MKEKYLSVVYVSTATHEFSSAELVELLERSRKNNEQASVSGMLLHDDGNFMQVIEGPPESIRALHQKILRDPRHSGVITLLEQHIDEREFGDWQMAFRDVAALEGSDHEGYSALLSCHETAQDLANDPGRAKKLLLSFRSTLRTG